MHLAAPGEGGLEGGGGGLGGGAATAGLVHGVDDGLDSARLGWRRPGRRLGGGEAGVKPGDGGDGGDGGGVAGGEGSGGGGIGGLRGGGGLGGGGGRLDGRRAVGECIPEHSLVAVRQRVEQGPRDCGAPLGDLGGGGVVGMRS